MKIRSFVFLVSLTLLLALLSTGILLHTSAQSQPAVSAASAPLAGPHAEPIEVEDENEDKDRPTLSPVSHTAKTPPSATERNATSVAADCLALVSSSGVTYTTVQEAVDAAVEGDTVKVAGTCAGVSMRPRDDIATTGSVTQVVYLSKTLTIRGGYTATNWTTPDPEAYPTTLDAGSQGRVFYITGDINPTIEGINITGGDATGLGTGEGGGVYAFTATTTISGCQIYDNTATDGGGIALHSGDAKLSNNSVFSNMATNAAGGMSVSGGTVTLDDNAFYSNNAATLASGLYLSATHAVLSGNRIYTNTVDAGDGGGLYVTRTDAELINNVVIDNFLGGSLGSAGGGLYIDTSSARLLHTTIARNGGGLNTGVYIASDGLSPSRVTFTNTIMANHNAGINASTGNSIVTVNGILWSSTPIHVVEGSQPVTRENEYDGDAAFAADGYHLTGISEAIDKGVDAGVTTDIDGETRPLGTAPDLGADERESTAPPPEDIYYVALEGTDDANSCTDSAAPCATLQHAVDVANPGGEIRIAAGTYVTTSVRAGGRQQIAYITKTLTIRGGYTNTNWTTSDPISNTTTLNTEWQARGLYVANVDGLTIEGLRISRGLAAIGSGGGVHLLNSTATLNRNVFVDNLAQYGGALGLEGSNVTLTNNVIVDNRSTLNGHGIYVKGSSSQLLHTTLLRNGTSGGSGIYVVNDGSTYSTMAMTNTILVTHTQGISVTSGNTARINGILWYNTPVTVSSGTGAVVEVQNSHEGNPALAADGYHLTGSSVAAIDKGVDAGATTDIDGHDRPYGSAPDLGADELIAITAQAGAETTLTYTDAQGNPTIIRVPAGAVTESIVLVYTPVKAFTVPSGFAFAGHAFDLEAYRNGVHLPGFSFQVPLSITIHYSDADVVGMDENGLNLYYWTGSAWENAVSTCSPSSVYDRSPGDNQLRVSVCHLSRFALFEAGSDVMITAMSIQPLTPTAGEPITITVQVRNQGGAHTTIWNDPTAAWFVVEVYAKGSDFTPAGPPTGPFDHAGGSAGDHWDYIAYPGGLAPQTNDILAFQIVLDDPDTYSFYAQADVSWEGADPPWGQSFGLIAEADEANNIYTFGQVVVESGGQEVYLPVVLKSVNSALGSSSP